MKRRYSMERKEEQLEERKTISIEEYLNRRQKKRNQERDQQGAATKEKDSPAYMWAELYV